MTGGRLPVTATPQDTGAEPATASSRSSTTPSTLVTLYLTPVVYTYMAQLQTWLRATHRPVIGHVEPAR